jgi:flagellar hook-basal body complex protein FliE
MSLNIPAISPLSQINTDVASPTVSDGGSSFKNILSNAIGEVEGARSDAAKSVEQFLSGSGQDLHSTILASQRADLEFQMFMQVRNKVVSAYQEIMKMPM